MNRNQHLRRLLTETYSQSNHEAGCSFLQSSFSCNLSHGLAWKNHQYRGVGPDLTSTTAPAPPHQHHRTSSFYPRSDTTHDCTMVHRTMASLPRCSHRPDSPIAWLIHAVQTITSRQEPLRSREIRAKPISTELGLFRGDTRFLFWLSDHSFLLSGPLRDDGYSHLRPQCLFRPELSGYCSHGQ